MKKISIKKITMSIIAGVGILLLVILHSCVESQKVAGKNGTQLWAENCQRCHKTPSSTSFSHEQWVTIGMHMQTRAQITNNERDKIIAFLSQ